MRPVEPGARQQLHRAAVEPGIYAVAVKLDFVQPVVAFRCRVDELRELRRDPVRQSGSDMTTGCRSRHSGSEPGLGVRDYGRI